MKYCVNCENPIEAKPAQNNLGYPIDYLTDFCSQECADEYLSNADERVLLAARESNPDALPIAESSNTSAIKSARTITGHLTRPIDGSLPPSTLEAVQSLLQIGGVSRETIDQVINIDKTNNQELAFEETHPVKDNSQNE